MFYATYSPNPLLKVARLELKTQNLNASGKCFTDENGVKLPGLQAFRCLPYDVQTNIMNFTHPVQLLLLSRCTKKLRAGLLTRSNKPIWEQSFRHAGFPSCTPDIAEPAFVSLVYEPYCRGCGVASYAILWQFRTRLCKPCQTASFTASWALLPSARAIVNSFLLPCHIDLDDGTLKYSTADIERLVLSIGECRTSEEKMCRLRAFETITELIYQHADRCALWNESVRTLLKRQEDIIAFLTGMGWKVNEPLKDFILKHPFCLVPKRLRDSEWRAERSNFIRHVTDALWFSFDRAYFRHRRALAAEIWDEHRARVHWIDISVADVVQHPTFRAIIESDISVAVDEHAFERVLDVVAAELGSDYIRRLASLVPGRDPDMRPSDTLNLAYISFDCTICGARNLPYTIAINHGCLTSPKIWQWLPPEQEKYACALEEIGRRRWLCESVLRLNPGTDGIKWLTYCIGADPERTSAAEMDALDVRVRCGACVARGDVAYAMQWREAAQHVLGDAHPAQMIFWTLLSVA